MRFWEGGTIRKGKGDEEYCALILPSFLFNTHMLVLRL